MTTGLSCSVMYSRNELNVLEPCASNVTVYSVAELLLISTVEVSNAGSVSGYGAFSKRNRTLVGVAAEAVNVTEPPLANVNG